jgi:hypothetical protein
MSLSLGGWHYPSVGAGTFTVLKTPYKQANVSAMHENISGCLWPLHHSVFSDLKKKTLSRSFNYQNRSLADHVAQVQWII